MVDEESSQPGVSGSHELLNLNMYVDTHQQMVFCLGQVGNLAAFPLPSRDHGVLLLDSAGIVQSRALTLTDVIYRTYQAIQICGSRRIVIHSLPVPNRQP